MKIFVEKGDNRLGPYSVATLRDAIAQGAVTETDPAFVEGEQAVSSVGAILQPRKSTKLQRPTEASAPAAPAIPERLPSRAAAFSQLGNDLDAENDSEEFLIERLRFIGAVTPLLMLLVLMIPWVDDVGYYASGPRSGYSIFAVMPFPSLLFAVAAGGIGFYAFEGASEGGIRHPLQALGCSLFGIVVLVYIWNKIHRSSDIGAGLESGSVLLCGGWHFTMATILLGTAGAILPSSEFPNNAKVSSWILSGLFIIAGIIFAVRGLTVG